MTRDGLEGPFAELECQSRCRCRLESRVSTGFSIVAVLVSCVLPSGESLDSVQVRLGNVLSRRGTP